MLALEVIVLVVRGVGVFPPALQLATKCPSKGQHEASVGRCGRLPDRRVSHDFSLQKYFLTGL